MKLIIEIDIGNEAMHTYDDIFFAIAKAGERLSGWCPSVGSGLGIYDTNGNRAGKWEIVE